MKVKKAIKELIEELEQTGNSPINEICFELAIRCGDYEPSFIIAGKAYKLSDFSLDTEDYEFNHGERTIEHRLKSEVNNATN